MARRAPVHHVGSARIFFWLAILCGALAILDTVLAARDRVGGGVGRTGQPWPDASVRTRTDDFRPHSPRACRRIEWDRGSFVTSPGEATMTVRLAGVARLGAPRASPKADVA